TRAKQLYALREVDPEERLGLVLSLKPLASAEGIVLDQELQPVAGASVFADMRGRLAGALRRSGQKELAPQIEATTDQEGVYRFDKLLDGTVYWGYVEADGLGASIEEFTAQSGAVMQLPELMLSPVPPAAD
ncbi:unnamed protein product, partial [marine sediment metagenome]